MGILTTQKFDGGAVFFVDGFGTFDPIPLDQWAKQIMMLGRSLGECITVRNFGKVISLATGNNMAKPSMWF